MLDVLFVFLVVFVLLMITHFIGHGIAATVSSAAGAAGTSSGEEFPDRFEWWNVSRLRMSFYILCAVNAFAVILIGSKWNELKQRFGGRGGKRTSVAASKSSMGAAGGEKTAKKKKRQKKKFKRYMVPLALLTVTTIAALVVINTGPVSVEVAGEPRLEEYGHGTCVRFSDVRGISSVCTDWIGTDASDFMTHDTGSNTSLPVCADIDIAGPLWTTPTGSKEYLKNVRDALKSGIFEAQFGQSGANSRDFYRLFNSTCDSLMVKAMCSYTFPRCDYGDCEPSTHVSCTRAIMEEFRSCLGLSLEVMREELDRFTLDWLVGPPDRFSSRPGLMGYTTADAVCALRWWFEGFQAAFNHSVGASADSGALCDVTLRPKQELSDAVRCEPSAMRSVEQLQTVSVKYELYATAFGLVIAMSVVAVAMGGSTVPAPVLLWRQFSSRRSGLRRGRVSVGVLGLLSTGLLVGGGYQTMLAPNGIPPAGTTCGGSAAGTSRNTQEHFDTYQLLADAAGERQTSGFAVVYFVLALAAIFVTLNIVLPPPGQGKKKNKRRKRRKGIMKLLCFLRMKYKGFFGVAEGRLGSWYFAKFVLFETIEIIYKFSILLSLLEFQESTVIVSMFILVGCNLIVLPFSVLNVLTAKRRSRALLMQLVVNIFIDKTFTLMGVFLRVPTTDALKTFGDKFVYHGFVLFSEGKTLRTFYKVIKLSKFAHTTRSRRAMFASSNSKSTGGSRNRSRSSSRSRSASSHRNSRGSSGSRQLASLRRAASSVRAPSRRKQIVAASVVAFLCMLGGTTLVAIPVAHVVRCNQMWDERLGDLAPCASPRYFFADSTCGLSRITSIDIASCPQLSVLRSTTATTANGTSSSNGTHSNIAGQSPVGDGAAEAPLRVPEWLGFVEGENLGNLSCIDLHGARLHRVPLYWRLLGRLHTLNLSNTQLAALPAEFCVAGGDTRLLNVSIALTGSLAAHFANWSHAQPSITNVTKDITRACLTAISRSVKELDLSFNNIGNTSAGLASLDIFSNLQQLSLRANGVTEIIAWKNDYDLLSAAERLSNLENTPFGPIMARKRTISALCDVNFHGNPLRRLRFSMAWSTDAVVTTNWMRCISGLGHTLEHLDLYNMVQVGDSHLQYLQSLSQLTFLRIHGALSATKLESKDFAVMNQLRHIDFSKASLTAIEPGFLSSRTPNIQSM